MKMRRQAEKFSRTTRCLILWWDTFLSVDVTNFSIKTIFKDNSVTQKRKIFS